ncbi:ring-cleaving dioxygenase [Gordoniibacillus kamchatkensis]|uniref:Ring-cleaving dioxygenase n=1 Tax=Gordoniibacillus kamchatkensis TaxID=1590651 RepID=A0ABR5A5W4_9BACL|nr:ring-cleaving dioxygenase [Paenibacillus sp. VKM B-2647]KIL36424.1 ring-cleaving dioxygenase [Paenibacillus sp. VKM B-2647]
MTVKHTTGIHHITAFAGDPQKNVDFYAGLLGLRLVKRTINFDAPEVYHLYFGNESGAPGTVMTFFPYAGSRRGRIGGGQVGATVFAVPPGAYDFWKKRLNKFGVSVTETVRFGETFLQFADPDGLRLEIVEREEGPGSAWSFGGIPAGQAIKGFGGAVLFSIHAVKTGERLEKLMGLERVAEEGDYIRYKATGDIGNFIDLRAADMPWGEGGAGTVHHIAWRAADDADQLEWRECVAREGLHPTQVLDRNYFHSVYFREEGGILFEIATDNPGFAVDEAPEALGGKLMLPDWFEPHRAAIEANLQPFEVRVLKGDAGE